MAYCTAADCRVYAKQPGFAAYTFTGEIQHATDEADAMLRSVFTVPLTEPVPGTIRNAVAMWSAGLTIQAAQAVLGVVSEYAKSLIERAKEILRGIAEDPSLVDIDLREPTADDETKSGIVVSADADPIFDLEDPKGWG